MLYLHGESAEPVASALRASLVAGDNTPVRVERGRVLGADHSITLFIAYWVEADSCAMWLQRSDVASAIRGELSHTVGVLAETARVALGGWSTSPLAGRQTPGVHDLGGFLDARSTESRDDATQIRSKIRLMRAGRVWNASSPGLTPSHDCGARTEQLKHPQASSDSSSAMRFIRDQSLDGDDLDSASCIGWMHERGQVAADAKIGSVQRAILRSAADIVHASALTLAEGTWHETALLDLTDVVVSGTVSSPLHSLSGD